MAKRFEQDDAVERVAKLPWGEEVPEPGLEIVFDGDPRADMAIEIRPTTGSARKAALAALSEVIPASTAKAVLDAEKQLLEWMAKKESRPARFWADPLGGMAAAGIKLDPHDAAVLARLREQRRLTADLSGLQDARSVVVNVAKGRSKPKGKEKAE